MIAWASSDATARVNEVPFEHCGVAGDDPAPFVGRELLRVWERHQQLLACAVDVFLDWRYARSLGSDRGFHASVRLSPLRQRLARI